MLTLAVSQKKKKKKVYISTLKIFFFWDNRSVFELFSLYLGPRGVEINGKYKTSCLLDMLCDFSNFHNLLACGL